MSYFSCLIKVNKISELIIFSVKCAIIKLSGKTTRRNTMKNKCISDICVLSCIFVIVFGTLAGCASTSKPNISDKEVLVWANEALLATFNYDYANYTRQLQVASMYYTPEAWQAYLLALETSGNLKTVIKKKM